MITVRALLAEFSLEISVVAGLLGEDQPITWAHAVDLPDPWRWINKGNLVMTTGVGLPRNALRQVEWVEKLAESGASALIFARHERAPELSADIVAAANRLRFPILNARFELEFVRLSKFVIESILADERNKLRASERLFQIYAEALRASHDMNGRLQVIARHLQLKLTIEDSASEELLFGAVGDDKSHGDHRFLEKIPIEGRSRTSLVIQRDQKEELPDRLILQSLIGLLGVELERIMLERDAQRQDGEALLRSALEEDTDLSQMRPALERRGLHGTIISVAIKVGSTGQWNAEDIHQAPSLQLGIPWVQDGEILLGLIPEQSEVLVALRKHLGTGTVFGISGPVTAATGLREADRQARFSLAYAIEAGLDQARYGSFDGGLVLAPRTLAESRALVGRYLGVLIEHDRTNDAALLPTLIEFLSNDGNWKTTAFELNIHRQTLVYRLKLIERLTGFKPTTTDGASRFWFAILAGKNAKLFN